MKFAVVKNVGAVVVSGDGCVTISELGFHGTLEQLIIADRGVIDLIESRSLRQKNFIRFEQHELEAPLKHPGKIVAVGLNYLDHASESKMELPKHPLVFTKFTSSVTGPYDPVIYDGAVTDQVDYEVELAVVIGKKAKNVSKEDALDHVFGYTIINDVSARDIQFADGQWVRGKSLDTFCPMGPWIVTADEIADPQNLRLACTVNGTTLQDASTADMIFGVADLISILSRSFTFLPGDIIATGTPSGVGFARKPPVFLKNGDVMITEVEKIGKLINKVKTI